MDVLEFERKHLIYDKSLSDSKAIQEDRKLKDDNRLEIKLWVKALRSGKYKQNRGTLQTPEGYCCLGVACAEFIPLAKQIKRLSGVLLGGFPTAQPYAPEWLRDIGSVSFFDELETLSGFTIQMELARLNDRCEFKFEDIADLLEFTFLENHEYLKDEEADITYLNFLERMAEVWARSDKK